MKRLNLKLKWIRPTLKPISGAPDLLPFINIFFLLLFFFMLGSSFVAVSGIPINLPESSVIQTYSVKKYIVTVDAQKKIYFNDTVMHTLDQLKSKLLTEVVPGNKTERSSVVLRIDKSNDFETVARIMALTEELHLNTFILVRKNTSQQTVFSEKEKP